MYAAHWADKPSVIDVYDSRTWDKLRSMHTPCGSGGGRYFRHTLLVTDDRIRFCCRDKNKLYIMDKSGSLLPTHGRSRHSALDDGPGVLRRPYVCQSDADNSVLIADTYNNRLQD